jgi:hypothetical protein
MELNEYLELVRDAELQAKAAQSPDDEKAWLEIAESWRRIAMQKVEQGGVASDVQPTNDQAEPRRTAA